MPKEIRVNAVIDPALKKRLYRVLLEEGLTFSTWLRRQIEAYLKKKEPKKSKEPTWIFHEGEASREELLDAYRLAKRLKRRKRRVEPKGRTKRKTGKGA